MKLASLSVSAMLSYAALTAGAQDILDCRSAEEYVTHLGFRFPVAKSFSDQSISSYSFRSPDYDVRYVRVLLELLSEEGDWHLVIRDRNGRPLQALGPGDFAEGTSALWTNRLYSDYVYFDLINRSGGYERRVRANELVVMPQDAPIPFYSVIDPENIRFRNLYGDDVDEGLSRLGDSVGFLIMTSANRTWSCTGLVVGHDLFLTNWHCGGTAQFVANDYWNDLLCENALIDMSWDGDATSAEFSCEEVVAKSRELDYGLLRISAIGHDQTPRAVVINPGRSVTDGEPLSVVHHPLGDTKQITPSCRVVTASVPGWAVDGATGAPNQRLTHDCDTEGGSSGAPIFNVRRELVAMHHAGFERDPETCRPADRVNKAILIREIVDSLPSDLRSEILERTRSHDNR